ncbi:hypothetical protein [Vibrio cholerae]|uniref:hypothetical protein n=1 Tax=Vibrio cholerae TaxID=666 RepID=UPI000E0B3FDD|nr:hypothetical protein [Vibrio cholerae]
MIQQEHTDYLSHSHFESAFFFAEMANKIECASSKDKYFQRVAHDSFVMNAIISSVCALEAHINEFSHLTLAELPNSTLAKFDVTSFEKQSIIDKYSIILDLLKKEPFDKSIEPYQSVDLLIKLRNALVHYKPFIQPIEINYVGNVKPIKLVKQLKGKFNLNPLVADWTPLWTGKILSAGCANWAAESALNFIFMFSNKFGDTSRESFSYNQVRKFANSAHWENIP